MFRFPCQTSPLVFYFEGYVKKGNTFDSEATVGQDNKVLLKHTTSICRYPTGFR